MHALGTSIGGNLDGITSGICFVEPFMTDKGLGKVTAPLFLLVVISVLIRAPDEEV
jgi:hypothetical protein